MFLFFFKYFSSKAKCDSLEQLREKLKRNTLLFFCRDGFKASQSPMHINVPALTGSPRTTIYEPAG